MRKRELAAHMQRTEAAEVCSYLAPSPRLARAAGDATRRIGGVTCLAARRVDEPFLNRALGFGTIADASAPLLERIERHYASIGKPPRIAIATGHVPTATLRLLERRGYRPVPGRGEDVYIYDRRRPPAAHATLGLTIERIGPSHAAEYARTSSESFADRGPMFFEIVQALIRSRRRGVHAFLGRIDGEPAATGMLWDLRPVAGLGNGSVRPAFRGHGLQKAMLAHRVRTAWDRGYHLFFSQTESPASAHNMDALGFRKLYDEVVWSRDP